MDNDEIVKGLVGNYLTIEEEISGQKEQQRALRSAIRALKGLETLKEGIASRKANIKADREKAAAKAAKNASK